jgi:PAS domain S-box-containing protein
MVYNVLDCEEHHARERFRSVFRDARIGMAIVSLEGCFLAVNRAFCEFLGYSEEELLRKDVASITYSEDLPRTIGLLHTVVAQGKQSHPCSCSSVQRCQERHKRAESM